MSRTTIHHWVKSGQLERDLLAGPRGIRRALRWLTNWILQGDHRRAPRGVSEAVGEAAVRRGPRRGLSGLLRERANYVRVARPCEPVEPVVRFETPAGRQGQVDFGTFTLPWGRRHALVVVLGYSRLLWLRFFPRQTMPILMEGLESAFETFGGVPDELLFDQMRAVVLSDDRAAAAAWCSTRSSCALPRTGGSFPAPAVPTGPGTKGKVERPIRYIRESFFYGREFANDNDLNEQAARWLEGTANVRRHATIGEPPVERFERDERAVLLPLANCPYRRLGIRQARSQRRGALRQPWRSSGDRSRSMRRRCNEGPGADTARPAAGDAGRPEDARRAGGRGRHPLGGRRRHDLGGRGHRAAPERPDRAAQHRRLQTAMRSSRLPAVKTLEQFDFAFRPASSASRSRACTSSASSIDART